MMTDPASYRPASSLRDHVRRWIWWLGLVHFGAIPAQAQGFRPVPTTVHFDGASIPPPPRQGSPWEAPPTQLPQFLITATADLCDAGMADPRGCEYRAVEIGDDEPVATHGFVFNDPDHPDRWFVVGWDALVYPALQVGDAVDLDGDIGELAESIRADRAALAAQAFPGGPAIRPFQVAYSGRPSPILRPLATVKDSSALKVCLLLRSGRADLAERLYAAGTSGKPDDPQPTSTRSEISLHSLALEWTSRAYARAAEALIRADDVVALDMARRLMTFVRRLEPRLVEVGPPRGEPNGRILESSPPFGELPVMYRRLFADLERRAVEPPRTPIPGPEAPPGERVAALIRDLDQFSSLHQINFDLLSRNNFLQRALIAAGDAAVEPLLAAFESDDRLTRYFAHDDPFRGYDPPGLVPVHGVARWFLLDIFQTRMIPGATERIHNGDPAARRSQAAAMRVFWAKNRSLSELDRLYRELDDPQASQAEWFDAANKLTQVDSFTPASAMRGEPLRSRTNPSVTELLARRVEAIDPAGSRLPPGSLIPYSNPVETANRLAQLLATWDLNGAVPVLRSRFERTNRVVRELQASPSKQISLESDLATLTLLRQSAGDLSALDEYAAWIVTTTPSGYDRFSNHIFRPLARFADHPALQRAAVALFDNPRSPWVPLFRPSTPADSGNQSGLMLEHLVSGPMLGVDPFRRLVRAGLDDQTVVGSVTTDPQGEIEIKVDSGYRHNLVAQTGSPHQPEPGTSAPIRVADLHLWKLGPIDGLPATELWWPLAERDRSIAVAAATLDQYGLRFRERPDWGVGVPKSGNMNDVPSSPSFERLNHPATREDVGAGRAIFHLEGREVRVWPLAEYPTHVRWTTRPLPINDPADPRHRDPIAAAFLQNQLDNLREAWVCQAEEVRVDGHWQRFFGLIDRDQFVRVPAEDVEFLPPAAQGWQTFPNDFDLHLTIGVDPTASPRQARNPRVDQIIPVEIEIRNHRGVTVNAPTDWVRSAGGISLAQNINLRLFYRAQPFQLMDPSRPDERKIPARPVGRHEEGFVLLEPAAIGSAGRFDLRDLFAVDQVGWYRIVLTVDGWVAKRSGGGRSDWIFEIRPAIDPPPKP